MNHFSSRTLAASVFTLIVLAGCQSARMPIPAIFEDQAPLIATRGTSLADPYLRIGAYEARDFWRIDAEAPRALGTNSDASTPRAGAHRYGFTLRLGTTDLWDASCSKQTHPAAAHEQMIACTITAKGNSEDTWTLMLKAHDGNRMLGMIQQGTETYQVLGTNETRGGIDAWQQTGYLIGALGQSVAAVDFTDTGRVWLHTSDNVRMTTLMTAVSATLLITEEIRTA